VVGGWTWLWLIFRAEKLGMVLISNNCFDGSCGIGFAGTV